MHKRSLVAVVVLTAAVGFAVVAVVRPHTQPAKRPVTSQPPHTAAAPPGSIATPKGTTLLASIRRATERFSAPDRQMTGVIEPTWDNAPVTLPVIAQHPGWLEVRLPERPNGLTGWVRSDDVALSYTPYRIVVEEAQTKLLLEYEGHVVKSFPAGIGTPTDPTPTGDFFVAYFARPPSSGYGPFVMATSAHSDAITDWEHSGDAEIAIHGPLGMDAAIGNTGAEISHGCIRLHDTDLVDLRDVPVGTPVEIVRA